MKNARSTPLTVGVCDIGTFTALILIARADRHGLVRILEERHTIDLLADSGTGTSIDARPLRRLQRISKRFNRLVRQHACDRAITVCTAAVRKAENRAQVVHSLSQLGSHPVVVLSARSEARLSARGAQAAFKSRARQGIVIDVGGGSTEVIDLATGQFHGAPIGAAKATGLWQQTGTDRSLARAVFFQECAQQSLSPLPQLTQRPRGKIIGTGGTLATLAAISGGLMKFDPARIQGKILSSKWIASAAQLFSVMTVAEIADLVPFDRRRARVLTAGTFLWAHVLNRLCVPSVTVSVYGLRWGVASQLALGGKI